MLRRHKATTTPAPQNGHHVHAVTKDSSPKYLSDIIDAVANWETNFDDLLPVSFKRYLDHLYAPIEAIDDARAEIALEGQQISDEIVARFPDLVQRSLGQDHPLTVALIEDHGR